MKVIATSEVPVRVPYIHFGYTAATVVKNVALSAFVVLLLIAGWFLGKIFRR
jgi:hypothetical protein